MEKNLPARPNLDHLRRQAKTLLSGLAASDPAAVDTVRRHLPSAQTLTEVEVLAISYCLADAQSAVARQSGFASWPHLARHVEQLRALEGIWAFTRLEIDGGVMPASALTASRLLIDGDRFRTESPEATYEGIFNINVEAEPHEIDIEFVAGPEAGNWNHGIYRLAGNQLELCLDLNGRARPGRFGTIPGSGQAWETLTRTSPARPQNVTGGAAPVPRPAPPAADGSTFEYVAGPTLTRLQGRWKPMEIIRDGQSLPTLMLWTGLRTAEKNEVKISFAGQTMIHALIRLDEATNPLHVDYYNLGGEAKGTLQHGLFQWRGAEACFCMAGPGQPRPGDFTCPAGSGRTFSRWRPKK